MVTAIQDEQLMLRVAGGDVDALNTIVLRHQRFVWAVATRFLGNPAEAEDITQETFLKILEAAPRYRPTADFRAYLYRIVSRLCIDHARKKRPAFTGELPDPVDCSLGPAATLASKEREAEIRRAVDRLPPRQRMAIILKYFHGLSYADIAHALGTTVKAVERLLSRARAALGANLSDMREK